MPNPFFTSKPTTSLNDIYKMLSTSNNPQELFAKLAKNNPQMAPILNLLNNGYSPEQVFNMLCKQRGVNPQEFLNSITKGNNT